MLYYVIAPLYSLYKFHHPLNDWAIYSSSIVIIFTIVFYFIMRRLSLFSNLVSKTHLLATYVETDRSKVLVRVLAGLAVGLFLYLISVYFIYKSSITEVFSNPFRFRLEMGKGFKTLFYLLQYHWIYTLFFLYIAYRIRFGLKILKPFVVLYALFLMVLGFSYGSRGILLALPLQVVIILELFGRRPKVSRILIGLVPAVVIFGGYQHYRNTGLSEPDLPVSARLLSAFSMGPESIDQLVNSVVGRADASENLGIYLSSLRSGDLHIEPMSSFFKAPLQLIPRDVFPTKPYYFSSDMTRQLLPEVFEAGVTYDFTGIAEWIHNFGLGLLPLFALIPAVVLCAADRCYREGDPFITYAVVYIPLGNLPIAIVNNGFLNTSNVVWLPLTVAICAALSLSFLRHRPFYLLRPSWPKPGRT